MAEEVVVVGPQLAPRGNRDEQPLGARKLLGEAGQERHRFGDVLDHVQQEQDVEAPALGGWQRARLDPGPYERREGGVDREGGRLDAEAGDAVVPQVAQDHAAAAADVENLRCR